ncbi:MAG: NnrS family protein [Hyphomicrobiales bacterium]|nr:NnrS family protein [Hyphomicrobiales bacterium]
MAPPPRHGPWLFALGFRPFFLFGALFAVLWLPLWLATWTGVITLPTAWAGAHWHAHEMVFGYAFAIIAGFLLTAVYNWTGRPHLGGPPLMALVALWAAGRLAMVLGGALPAWLVAVLDVAFVPALALTVAVPLAATGNRRNYLFLPILAAAATANLAAHLGAAGWVEVDPATALVFALDLVILVIAVIGGRIVPSFTHNALPTARITRWVWLERLALPTILAMAVVDLLPGADRAAAVLALLAAAVHALRLRGWGGLETLRSPILWVLHLGYAWLVLGLALRGLSGLTGLLPMGTALHALTIGLVGVLTLGMISRVALGHTGRPLKVTGAIAAAYVLVTAAAVARLAGAALPGGAASAGLILSGLLWTAGFALYVKEYWAILTGPPAR